MPVPAALVCASFLVALSDASPLVDSSVEAEAISTPVSSVASGVGAVSGGSVRGSTRMRETSKGTGGAPVSDALSSRPPVETVTLRAAVARPIRTTGSLVMRTGSGSITGAGSSSGAVVGQAGVADGGVRDSGDCDGCGCGGAVLVRRGRVTLCDASCARGAVGVETRRHGRRAAAKILWAEERIPISLRLAVGTVARGVTPQ